MRSLITVGLACGASALQIMPAMTPMRGAAPVAAAPMLAPVSLAPRAPQPAMVELDDASKSFYDEYKSTDPTTGESTALSLGEKGARATRASSRHATQTLTLFFVSACVGEQRSCTSSASTRTTTRTASSC